MTSVSDLETNFEYFTYARFNLLNYCHYILLHVHLNVNVA